eukprot:g3991.t1
MGGAASCIESEASKAIVSKIQEDFPNADAKPLDVAQLKILQSRWQIAGGVDASSAEAYESLKNDYTTMIEQEKVEEPEIRVVLKGLPDAIDTACYMYDRWPLVVDPTSLASRYLKYNGSYVMASIPGQTTPESLRKMYLACLKHGTMMIFNFSESDCSTFDSLFDSTSFPAAVMDRRYCFDKSVWGPLLKPDSGEDEPDYFVPNESFKLILVTENPNPTTKFDSVFKRVTILESNADNGAGGESNTGGADEVELLLGAKEVIRNSEDLCEFAFDGDLDAVKDLIEKGYHMDSMDAHEHTALSEAAAQGHSSVVEYLLHLGADPNKCNDKGRSPLYRAAFNAHTATVKLLLEAGADPDKQDEGSGEMPMDACTDEGTQAVIAAWDRKETKRLLVKREEAIAKAAEERMKTAAQRELYARSKVRDELVELASKGEHEALEEKLDALADEAEMCEGRPTGTAESRDNRGNTLLAVASWKGHEEVVKLLLTKYKTLDPGDGTGDSMFGDPDKYKRKVWRVNVNARDQKGWTPIQVAVFHKHKNIVKLLLEHGGDPKKKNSYGKDAFELAQSEMPPNLKLMRWYDPELLKKDMEAKNNYAESECSVILREWAEQNGHVANTLGVATAAEEKKKKKGKSDKSKESSGDKDGKVPKKKGKAKGKGKGKGKVSKKKSAKKK